MIYIFTSAAWNYLPKAQILADSVRKYLPGCKMILALPDALTADVDIGKYNFDEVIPLTKELCPVDNLNAWIFSHSIVELATAIKPFILCQLLERPDCEAVLYFDPDVELFSGLDDLLENFRDASILLTPHITSPEKKEENVVNFELCPLQFGVYNFGFFGVKNSPVGKEYADWWRKRLERFCYDDIPNGIFTDQKWNDIVPGIFPEVKILRETRFNAAAWNTTNRMIVKKGTDSWEVDGKPLGFYHFTGLDSGAHHDMIRQFSCNPTDQIKFIERYKAKMDLASQDPLCRRPWAFATFLDGVKIEPEMRVYVRNNRNVAKTFRDPFDPEEKPKSFRQWYQENVSLPEECSNSESLPPEEQIRRLKDVVAEQQQTIRTMEHTLSWRLTSPFRKSLDRIKAAKLFILLRKTVLNYREYGLRWTFRKMYGFLARGGKPAIPAADAAPEKSGPVITEEAINKIFSGNGKKDGALADIREKLENVRHYSDERLKPILFFTHPFYGGAVDYLQSFLRENPEHSVFAVRPSQDGVILDLYYKDHRSSMKFRDLDCLLDPRVGMKSCHEIVVNHLLGWQWLFREENLTVGAYEKIINRILAVKKQFSAEMRYMMHDFLAVCPQYTLLDKNDSFCCPDGETGRCAGCIPALSLSNGIERVEEIRKWRSLSNSLISECRECRFFSSSAKEIAEKVLSSAHSVGTVVPHEGLVHYEPLKTFPEEPVTIGVVGTINLCKGARFLAKFAEYLKTEAPEARIVIIGRIDHPPYPANVTVHGAYKREELPELLQRYGVNVGFISSVWPETFSYVTQELMELGLPLVCFDLGAQAERIAKWGRGMVIPDITPECAWKTICALHGSFISENARP